ncbi:MAG: hypothetical protein HYS59_02085 [Candidatus Vogelbacteria bacterium]|nr:hypothetical protein [Candidatus Vogelbacteria bacterium]
MEKIPFIEYKKKGEREVLEFPQEYYRGSTKKLPREEVSRERGESRLNWLQNIRALAKKNYLALGLAALTWLSSEESGAKAERVEIPAEEVSLGAFTAYFGDEKVPVAVCTLEQFDPTGGERELSLEGGVLKNLTLSPRGIVAEHDPEKLARFYESAVKQPEVLSHAGLSPESDLNEISPKEAVLLARALIIENLRYDETIDAVVSEIEESAAKELSQEQSLQLGETLADIVSPSEIYAMKIDIVCRHSTELFVHNFNWLKSRFSKRLKNTYAAGVSGQTLLEKEMPLSHAWNRVVEVSDTDGDGKADRAAMTFLETTPLTRTMHDALERHGLRFDDEIGATQALETLEGLALLRREGAMDAVEYLGLYSDISNALLESLRKTPTEQLDLSALLQARHALIKGFESGAQTERELITLTNDESALIREYSEMNSNLFGEHRGEVLSALSHIIADRVQTILLFNQQAGLSAKRAEEITMSYLDETREMSGKFNTETSAHVLQETEKMNEGVRSLHKPLRR